jgi:predicted N-formylglutamate amidohydrolase
VNNRVLVLSCEHAVNTIPKKDNQVFLPYVELLQTHRGIDLGALSIARHLKKSLSCELVEAKVSRLLIDCNRSLTHAHCFSEITKGYSEIEKQHLIDAYYLPFSQQVIELVQKHITQDFQVWHLSIHSFTPILDNQIRDADIGLLYDPHRPSEKKLASLWQSEIKKLSPTYQVRKNYPYKGTSDGFTNTLRSQFSDAEYVGIEVESNQALVQHASTFTALKQTLALSLLKTWQLGRLFKV